MKHILNFSGRGSIVPSALAAAAFVALASVVGITVLQDEVVSDADMRIEPNKETVILHETFEIEVVVESSIPVNVFAGELHFNPDFLSVSTIDYNTSVADLWVEVPWYSNGEGTLNFGGGTTREGGFKGEDKLIKVTFKTLREGNSAVTVHSPRILKHDGLGTDVRLAESKDAVFTVPYTHDKDVNLVVPHNNEVAYRVIREAPSTDLNYDGKQSLGDVAIFMLNIAGNDMRYDFNLDGVIDIKDLNILLNTE